ncbi:MAG: OmpA family protein [bacterium]
MKKWISLAVVAIWMAGCGTVPYRATFHGPVVPAEGEELAVNQAVIVVDGSTSMQLDKIRVTRALVEAFAQTMPEGNYQTGMVIFGGDDFEIHNLQPVQESGLALKAQTIPFIGRSTPIGECLDQVKGMIAQSTGRTAVILFSDGVATDPAYALEAAKNLAASGDVCIHTVQISQSVAGGDLLRQIAGASNCGSARTGESIYTPNAMDDFVRTVFFTKGEAVTPPQPPVEIPVEAEKDSDGDGVPDSKDECPDTPKGAKVDERGCWIVANVYFDYDKAVVKQEYVGDLTEVASVLKQNPDMKIYVDGHCDFRGSLQYNQKLSERRADAVKNFLIDQGIAADRMVTRGYGETRPIRPNTTEENMAMNRRAEFSVIQ